MNAVWLDILKIAVPCAILILQQLYAWLSGRRAERTNKSAEKNASQLQEIHLLVNGNLAAATAKIASMAAEMEQLRAIITRLTPPPDSIVSLSNQVAELSARLSQLAPSAPPSVPLSPPAA